MLKFLFNRFSRVVYAMEIAGIIFTFLWFFRSPPKIIFGIAVLEYLFLRFCATWRWYKNAKRYEGIGLQFKKAMVPTSYIMAMASGVGYFTGSTLLLWAAIFLLAVILHVNVILLALHYKDKNTTPVNYYSGNKCLKQMQPSGTIVRSYDSTIVKDSKELAY